MDTTALKLATPRVEDLWKMVKEKRMIKTERANRKKSESEPVVQLQEAGKLVKKLKVKPANDPKSGLSEAVYGILEIITDLKQYQSVISRQKKEIGALHEEINKLKEEMLFKDEQLENHIPGTPIQSLAVKDFSDCIPDDTVATTNDGEKENRSGQIVLTPTVRKRKYQNFMAWQSIM